MGPLAFDQGSLKIGPLAGTLMACPDDLTGFRSASMLSDKKLKYQFEEGGYLILFDQEREVLKYKPID